MTLRKSTLYNFIWISAFKLLIEFVYANSISENFIMFTFEFNITRYVISWVLLMFTFIIINSVNTKTNTRTSTLLLYLIYLFSYLPGISLWSLSNLANDFFIFFNIYWILILIMMFGYSKVKTPTITIKIDENIKNIMFKAIFLFSAIYGIYYSYKFSGLRIHFNLLTVYDLRSTDSSASTLEGLLYYIVSTVVYPLFAIYYYKNRKWLGFIAAVFLELLMFSVAGHKLYFFIIPVGIIAYHFYDDKFFDYIPRLLSLLVLGGILEQIIMKSGFIVSYFVRRIMYVPALLDSYYYEFFSNNSPTYFAQDKILSRLGLKSPYSRPVSRVIGDVYANGSNANTGLFGDAFSNLGNYSVVIYPVIFLIAMILLDVITNRVSKKYYITVLVSIVMVLLNGEISGIFYNFILPMSILFLFMGYISIGKES